MGAEIAAAALLGALIGSFLNVVIYRVPAGESLVAPGSHCPSCGAPVRAFDNVPVVSWVVLRGHCRGCGGAISFRYPAVELLTAATFAAVVAVRGFDDDLWLELPFVACLIALAGIDLDHKLLPNRIVYPMAAYGLVMSALVAWADFPEHVLAGAGAFLFLLIAVLAYPSGMGMGDVKLGGAMGLYLGLSDRPRAPGRLPDGHDLRAGRDRPRGRPGAQEGRSVRHLPGLRRPGRSARGAGADRLLRVDFPELTHEIVQPG